MAKDATVTDVTNGDDIVDTWGDAVRTDILNLFADKTVYDQAYAPSTTFDLNNGAIQKCELAGDITIAVSNQKLGRPFVLIVKHDGTSRTINWFSTINWAYSYTPTPSAANKYDVLLFIPIAYSDPNWTYLGFVVGQEM